MSKSLTPLRKYWAGKVFFWVPLGRQQIQQTRNQQIQMIGATIWRFER
jgi:hypothetical protein